MRNSCKRLLRAAAVLSLLVPVLAHAALDVFACEPEWAALTQELAGDRVKVVTATTALQDPHHIEARPSLIARMRQADLVVCTGAELETGWLPLLLEQSGNARVRPGGPGYFEAAAFVALLDKPYQDARPAEWLAAQSGLPVAVLPFTVGGTAAAKDLVGLYDDTLRRLLGAAAGQRSVGR